MLKYHKMCQTIPAEIIKISSYRAIARDIFDSKREINISGIPNVKPGNWVLLAANLAIAEISKEEALEIKKLLNEKND
jgi:hydrogenase assembly chaperone HypC/HupF